MIKELKVSETKAILYLPLPAMLEFGFRRYCNKNNYWKTGDSMVAVYDSR